MIRTALVFGLFLVAGPAIAADIVGTPKIVDGETLEVDGKRFRLAGIDAPDPRQTCFIRNREYPCGRISTTALMDLVAGVKVRCRADDKEPGVARCWAGSYELSEGMVHTGWALATPRDHKRFAPIERQAAKARRELWQGEFVMPWDWKPDVK
ncbi:MAG: thermonuclease family protein [Alphaproteobacteria bacterium]